VSPVRVIGGKQCRQPKVEEIEAVFSCTVGSLAKGASVQMTVSFQMGRIAGRSIYLDMIPHTGSRDPKAKNNEAIVSADITPAATPRIPAISALPRRHRILTATTCPRI